MPWTKEDLEIIRAEEAGDLPPISESLARRMQAEADASAFLLSPEGAKAREILAMSQEEFEQQYPEIAFADAYDEEDAERERDPSTAPAPLKDHTMETYQAMEEKDAAARQRRRRPERA